MTLANDFVRGIPWVDLFAGDFVSFKSVWLPMPEVRRACLLSDFCPVADFYRVQGIRLVRVFMQL